MPERYLNKYRIASARAPFWDYGWNAAYFVTICTQNRECWFGEIVSERDALPCVSLSPIGEIAECEWLKTFEMRPDMNLWMEEYVIMPNHFHAIIGIGENEYNTRGTERGMERGMECTDAMHCVSTTDKTATNENQTPKNQFGPQSKNLASIIRGFKIGVTKNARQINPDFAWQPRYHDHIIRNEKSFQRISEYIVNNPRKWQEDKFYKS